jgi:hypothetical protein
MLAETQQEKISIEQIITDLSLGAFPDFSSVPYSQIGSGHREAIHLFPILPTSAVDGRLRAFGFNSNARANMINSGVLPAAATWVGNSNEI